MTEPVFRREPLLDLIAFVERCGLESDEIPRALRPRCA
jgi:hypothetical protein